MRRTGQAWIEAVGALGGDAVVAGVSAAELEQRYAEPHRRYHTGEHIESVLRDCAWLGGELRLGPREHAAVALAACAHDVVYDARPGEDERSSAGWAGEHLAAAGIAAPIIDRIRGLVLATFTHAATDRDDLSVPTLLDADLAILGARPPQYRNYVAAVRAEYAAVPDGQWRTGRSAVLTALLDRPSLYLSEPGRRRWEASARRNVGAELVTLAG